MIPVNLFNANTLAVTIGINNPSVPLWLGGTNAALGWQPQVLIDTVQLNPAGPPAPNVLAIGPNSLVVTPTGWLKPANIPLDMPGTMQWTSVQLYIFFDRVDATSWMILNAGRYVVGGLLLS